MTLKNFHRPKQCLKQSAATYVKLPDRKKKKCQPESVSTNKYGSVSSWTCFPCVVLSVRRPRMCANTNLFPGEFLISKTVLFCAVLPRDRACTCSCFFVDGNAQKYYLGVGQLWRNARAPIESFWKPEVQSPSTRLHHIIIIIIKLF